MTLDNKKQIITVDLHNMVKEQAKRYLEQFLNSISINVKEVHIIHGLSLIHIYISSSNLKNSSSPHKENYSVPSSPYFLQNDNIVISFHFFNTIYDTTIEKNYFQHFHNHDFYEINYIYRGEVINYLPDQTVHQNKNQVLLMNPLAYHRPVVQSPDTVLFNIMIRKEFSSDILHSGSFSNSNLIHVFLDSSLGLTPLDRKSVV